MKNNVESDLQTVCTGCGACLNICPVSAIQYKLNDKGFYQAKVNSDKCIECGKCKLVCSKFNKDFKFDLNDGNLYSGQSKDRDVINECTSGGIAYELAKYGIQNGYYIVGVVYDYIENKAKSIMTNNILDLDKIRGSKYIQSDTGKIWKDVIDKAKESSQNKFIIFGTPCQIFGIDKLIEKLNISNEIIKVELFCHGVPSWFVWEKYLKEIGIENIKNIKFRDKKYSWHDYYIKINNDKKNYYKSCDKDEFLKIFLDGVLLNDACQTCKLRQRFSCADLRLGDFWGEDYKKNEDGVSAIIAFNNQGEDLLNKININLIKKYDNVAVLNLKGDYLVNINREKCFKKLSNEKDVKLRTIRRLYLKTMTKKQIFKRFVKDIIAVLPDGIRRKIRKMIR